MNKKNNIGERKKEILERQGLVDQLTLDLNQKIVDYNAEQDRRMAEFNVLREEIDQFSQNLFTESVRKDQELKDKIKVKDDEAKEQWEKDKAALDQFQASLNINYGDEFSEFVEYFSHWTPYASDAV